MSRGRAVPLVLVALALATTACGLKGPLELPEKSTNVVIRGPQAPAGTATPPTTQGEPTPQTIPPAQAPAAPTSPGAPAAKPAAPPDDRMPPPPLPGGNPGSSRGG